MTILTYKFILCCDLNMDDTTQSRTSDAATSAATRKRRSSILKSQRPPRTPFCELEFNVCTPTDMTKSRRVSFSRRTGVAEFATNEATTTWKNFYEEHNKSLESSGNESEANHMKQPIAHLGKRIFDQQFEEVEAVDFIGSLNNGLNISTSINSINFTQLESTNTKLTAPQNNFELSALTEQQSKLFSDDLAITCHGEVTDGIDVNFSTIKQIGEKDDLDEIQKHLQQQRNIVCQGPFSRQNLSEYIEVDLNTTHVTMTNNQSDMSITDTIHSPKVQDVSKSCLVEKKISVGKDWVADKENIVVNPYVAPQESQNFAIHDEVLIFDGKKLVIRTESPKNEHYRQTLLPNPSEQAPQRKTIVLNCNDDLPNFIEDAQVSKNSSGFICASEQKQSGILDTSLPQSRLNETQINHRTILYNDHSGNISVTQVVPNVISNAEKRRTILYENDTGNISITQAVPSTIIDKDKRRTILYENDNDISTTQAVPVNVLLIGDNNQKRKTIVFENEACNISMTQALPANIITPNNVDIGGRTIIINDGAANMSITQPIPNSVEKGIEENRRTVAYEDNAGNISVTHSVTSSFNSENVSLPGRTRTIVIESDVGNVSVTQAFPSNIIFPRKPNVTSYENDGDLSMTQAVPTNILLGDKKGQNRRRTVVFEDDTGNLSITQAVSTNQVIQGLAYQQQINTELSDIVIATNEVLHINKISANDTRIIVFESDNGDISITKAVNLNQDLPGIINKQKEISNDSPQKLKEDQRRTIVFENDEADISMTQVVNINQAVLGINKEEKHNVTDTELEVATNTALHNSNNSLLKRRRTIMYENDEREKYLMQAVSRNKSLLDGQEKKLTVKDMDSLVENSHLFNQLDDLTSGLKEDKICEVPINKHDSYYDKSKVSDTKRPKKTIAYEQDKDMSLTRMIHEDFISKETQDKTCPKAFDESAPLLSKPIPAGLATFQFDAFKTSHKKYMTECEDMLENLTNMAVDDIFVYQTETAGKKKETTKKHDFHLPNAFPIEEDKATSTIITDLTTKMSLEIHAPQDELNGEQDQICQVTEADMVAKATGKENTIATLGFEPKNSILDDLLDMSQESLGGDEDKSLMAKMSSEHLSESNAKQAEIKDDMFFITNDSTEDVQIDKSGSTINKELESREITKIPDVSYYPLSSQCEEKPENDGVLTYEPFEMKGVLKDHSPQCQSSSSERLDSSKIGKTESLDEPKKQNSKCFKMANDTNELLEMLSDFTDKRISRNIDPPLENFEDKPESTFKEHLVSEKKEKTKEPEPRRISIASKRQSIALSREDLLTNLSMAGAALRRSRLELDESENAEDTAKETPQHDLSRNKNSNLSMGVVKTLNFDDEDSVCQKSESQSITPLKKTAFGEVTYMKESKLKVIPDYTEISDNIKTLMNDLVKPMADVLPYTTTTLGHGMKKSQSTCSMQIQANLLNSSQVDLQSEVFSNPESMGDEMHKFSSVDFITGPTDVSVSQGLSSTVNLSYSEKLSEVEDKPITDIEIRTNKKCSESHTRLLIFDHNNPLNNILINPPVCINAHKYNPIPPVKTISSPLTKTPENIESTDDSSLSAKIPFVSNQYRLESKLTTPLPASEYTDKLDTRMNSTNTCKPVTNDKFTKPETYDQKDSEANTVIVMKGNQELLAANSSLTLVDDALTHSRFDLKIDGYQKEDELPADSSLELIYKLKKTATEQLNSDFNGNDQIIEIHKPKKRTYSPKSRQDKHKHCTISTIEVTPKPAFKMQKQSFSPTVQKESVSPTMAIRPISPTIHMQSPSSKKQLRSNSPATIIQSASQTTQMRADSLTMTIRSASPSMQMRSVSLETQMRSVSPEIQKRSVSPEIKMQSVSPEMKLRSVNPEMKMRSVSPETKMHTVSPEMKMQSLCPEMKLRSVSPTIRMRSVSPEMQMCSASPTIQMKSISPSTQVRSVSPTMRMRPVSHITQKLDCRTYSYERHFKLAPEQKKNTETEKIMSPTRQKSPNRKSPRNFENKKPGTTPTIQRVTTVPVENDLQCRTDTSEPQSQTMSCDDLDALSPDASSMASSKNLRRELSLQSESVQSHLRMDWYPKTSCSEISSKSSFDSDQDIILKIDSLPFMGSSDCDWESSSGDTWSFLLLHSRLRFTVRFVPCKRVRADTPVLNVALETLHQERKNPIALLCVSYAAETMRYYMSRGCGAARDVARLVRRLGGAARVAARWARAMHDARARLAFSLTPDGWLSLKVANASLRAVWEVTMQLELVVEDARSAPWPRACGVRAARVLCGAAPAPAALRRLLRATPRDWGHVPRTIWKIFRYLKNKKREEDEMGSYL